MKDDQNGNQSPINLSELTAFQFGPAWARGAEESTTPRTERPRDRRESHQNGDRRTSHNRDDRPRGDRRPRRDSQAEGKDTRNGRRNQRYDRRQEQRPRREPLQPAEGFRVELRPANSILEIFSAEIQKQKRALPLMDLARVVMGATNRYDLVFMKLENTPALIHSTQGDDACWQTKEEAIAYLWTAPWFNTLYREEQVEIEAPKGNFTAVAVCSLGKELIGPANWHGYQTAIMNLYRSKYSNMPLDVFKNKITTDKSEETVAAWKEVASHKTVWKPVREGAEDIVLEDRRAVEADFTEHHFASTYETVDKIFINGATSPSVLSPGLAAHLILLGERTKRFPQMLIPNLCHGLARHHMPIYKWHGNHFTGPSRVRAIPADMVLADRMMAIVNWSKENSGKKAEEMFAELSGVPTGEDEASRQAATDAHAPYVADMIWLLEQGFIVVTSDNAVWFPKGEHAPEPTPAPTPARNKKRAPRKHAAKPAPKAKEETQAE